MTATPSAPGQPGPVTPVAVTDVGLSAEDRARLAGAFRALLERTPLPPAPPSRPSKRKRPPRPKKPKNWFDELPKSVQALLGIIGAAILAAVIGYGITAALKGPTAQGFLLGAMLDLSVATAVAINYLVRPINDLEQPGAQCASLAEAILDVRTSQIDRIVDVVQETRSAAAPGPPPPTGRRTSRLSEEAHRKIRVLIGAAAISKAIVDQLDRARQVRDEMIFAVATLVPVTVVGAFALAVLIPETSAWGIVAFGSSAGFGLYTLLLIFSPSVEGAGGWSRWSRRVRSLRSLNFDVLEETIHNWAEEAEPE